MSAPETIVEWLARLGLSRLEAAFLENGIDLDVLPSLTDDDLRELGLTLGDRKRVRAALSSPADSAAGAATVRSEPPQPKPSAGNSR